MDIVRNMFWEVGPALSNVSWKRGESIESPVLKSKDGVSWWLDFYPAGDLDNGDNLVFWLSRDNADRHVKVNFEIQFCFYSTPVRQYTLQHEFEKGEDVYKWVISDVKNLAQLKIFIPPATLCFIGYFTVYDEDQDVSPLKLDRRCQNLPVNV